MAEWVVALLVAVGAALPGAAWWQIDAQPPVQQPPEVVAPRAPLDEIDDVDDGDGGADEPTPDPGATEPLIDAVDDAVQTTADVPARINYTENDTYGEAVVPTIDPPIAGAVEIVAGADPHFVYTPDAAAEPGQTVTFDYTVCGVATTDACATARVTVSIVSDAQMRPPTTDQGDVIEGPEPSPTAPQECQEPLPWDGHRNGRIPDGAMTAIGGGHRLMHEAAAAFEAMRTAASTDGVTIGITDSYRSFEAQVRVREQKGAVVATARPGTSVHGWGKALDINVNDGRVRAWLEANSRAYAWINPPWAKRPGKSFEPWHYEYYGVDVDPDNPQCAGIGMALGARNGATEAALDVSAAAPAVLALDGRTVGLGGGALAALIAAAVIVVRDLQRGRLVRGERRP